jgi:hypothetical protein
MENAAMEKDLAHMISQVKTLEAAEVQAPGVANMVPPAQAQEQQGSGKLFMGMGAFGFGAAIMYAIMQKLFPSSQNHHDSRVVPLTARSSGAEMQQVSLKSWDPLNLSESQSSEEIAHGRAIMASLQQERAPQEAGLKKQGFDLKAIAGALAVTTAIAPTPAFAASAGDFGGYTIPIIGLGGLAAIIALLAGPVED